MRAKTHAVYHFSSQNISAVVSQSQLRMESIPSAATFMPQYEELLRLMASSIELLQEQEKNRSTPSTTTPNRYRPRYRPPHPHSGPSMHVRDRTSSGNLNKRQKQAEAKVDGSSQNKYKRCRRCLSDHPTSECRTLQFDEKTWGITWARAKT